MSVRGLGTLLNLAAIAAGASVGALLGDRLPGRLRETLVAALGLFTLALGVQQALAAFGDDLAGAAGLRGDLGLLAVKSLLDGFAMLAFASTLGWGVAASGLSVLVYQGGLTALAAVLQQVMTPAVVAAMTAVGGLLVIAIGLRLLGLARIRVANLLPAVLLAPLATGLLTAVQRP
jgi:uncharacterized membrane protein YqgA involved in biofilm formation